MKTPHIDSATQIIMHIARSFPLLKGKFHSYGYDPDRFHPQELLAMSKGWSTSEIHIRNFVLTTWNPSWAKQKRCTFDLFEALSIFDETNRQVLLHWLNQPCFPGAYLWPRSGTHSGILVLSDNLALAPQLCYFNRMQHSVIDERSLALDKVVVRRLREDPSLLMVAKATLKRWLSHCSDNVRPGLQEWQAWLDGDFESLLEFLGSDSPDAQRLRQSSPFAGPKFVSREERNQIFKRFRDDDTCAADTQS